MRNEEGRSPKEAVVGAKRLRAITSSTLTTVAAFAHIITQGLTRQIFADMGLTITFSLGKPFSCINPGPGDGFRRAGKGEQKKAWNI